MDNTFKDTCTDERMSELLGELTDALEIVYSCRRLDVPVTDQFLNYVDGLIDQIEAARFYMPMAPVASPGKWTSAMAEA